MLPVTPSDRSGRGEEEWNLLGGSESTDSSSRRTPRGSRRHLTALSASVSTWTVLAFFVLATVVSLPLLAYTRRLQLRSAGHEDERQIVLSLHPEQHTTRGPATLVFNWTITLGTRAPDGVEREVYLVNGTCPKMS